jgi:Holliday junction resolvase
MPNRNRAAGDRFEYRVRDTLVSQGWVVSRSAGSQGAMDLVALKAGRAPLLVSCKTNGRIDPWERQRLLGVAEQAGAMPVVVWRVRPGVMAMDRLTPSGARVHVAEEVRMPADRYKAPSPMRAAAALAAGTDATETGDDPAGPAPPGADAGG